MSATKPTTVLSHWNKMFDGLQQSSDQFYTETEQNLAVHQLKDVKIERVTFAESGLFGAKREYLQVRRSDHVYHVCAAPYGNGFFVSAWLGEVEQGFWAWAASIPYIGKLVQLVKSFAKPMTYYKADTTAMFHAVVHGSVLKALDTVLDAKGMRALTDGERKPIMRDMLNLL